MNRKDFQNLARQRIRDARVLLRAGCPAAAYYLAGYAVECALKACIARKTRRHEFPDKDVVNQSWTHKLEQLIKVAGLEQERDRERKVNPAFETNWGIVKDWDEDHRYDLGIENKAARDLLRAIAAPRMGLLAWLRQYW